MREYTVREGSMYSGTHTIFENVAEFRSNTLNPDIRLHRWTVDDFRDYQVGDYVMAEDGYITQILDVKEMKSKKERKGRTVFIRFPMGTFAVYEKADGSIHYPRFYAQFTQGDKGSASGRSRCNFTGSKDETKRRFANLMYDGIDSRTAYRLAFGYKRIITNSQIDRKITDMMKDEVVIQELKRLSKPVRDKFNELFSADRIVSQLEMLLDNCRKGSAAHRENLKLILRLRGLEV
jgi:hypothetical protein